MATRLISVIPIKKLDRNQYKYSILNVTTNSNEASLELIELINQKNYEYIREMVNNMNSSDKDEAIIIKSYGICVGENPSLYIAEFDIPDPYSLLYNKSSEEYRLITSNDESEECKQIKKNSQELYNSLLPSSSESRLKIEQIIIPDVKLGGDITSSKKIFLSKVYFNLMQ